MNSILIDEWSNILESNMKVMVRVIFLLFFLKKDSFICSASVWWRKWCWTDTHKTDLKIDAWPKQKNHREGEANREKLVHRYQYFYIHFSLENKIIHLSFGLSRFFFSSSSPINNTIYLYVISTICRIRIRTAIPAPDLRYAFDF